VYFENGRRELRIPETDFVYLDEGSYGVVFVDRNAGRVRKIFLNKNSKEHASKVFNSEARAYEVAAGVPELAQLIPGGFKRCQPQSVVNRLDEDISSEFFSDLVFEIDYIEGRFEEAGRLICEDIDRVTDLLQTAGIKHVLDMSVVLDADDKVVCAIDFAIEEFELFHS
jgi:hypothetical protein